MYLPLTMHRPDPTERHNAGTTVSGDPLCSQCGEWAELQKGFLELERQGFTLPSTPKWNTAVQLVTGSVKQRRCCRGADVNGLPSGR